MKKTALFQSAILLVFLVALGAIVAVLDNADVPEVPIEEARGQRAVYSETAQIFLANDSQGTSEESKITIDEVLFSGNFETYKGDLRENNFWKQEDSVNILRLDPIDKKGVITIQSIQFHAKDNLIQSIEQFDDWEIANLERTGESTFKSVAEDPFIIKKVDFNIKEVDTITIVMRVQSLKSSDQ